MATHTLASTSLNFFCFSVLAVSVMLVGCQATQPPIFAVEYAQSPDSLFYPLQDTVVVVSGQQIAFTYDGVNTRVFESNAIIIVAQVSETMLHSIVQIPEGKYVLSHRDALNREVWLHLSSVPRITPIPFFLGTLGHDALQVGIIEPDGVKIVDNAKVFPCDPCDVAEGLAPTMQSTWQRLMLNSIIPAERSQTWLIELETQVYQSGGMLHAEFRKAISSWRQFVVSEGSRVQYQGWDLEVLGSDGATVTFVLKARPMQN